MTNFHRSFPLLVLGLVSFWVHASNPRAKRAMASNEEGPARVVRCELRSGATVKAVDVDVTDLKAQQNVEFAGRRFGFRTLLKYGDYDSYPNVVVGIERGNELLSEFTLVGSRDEYGAFRFGSEGATDAGYGRCDVHARK